MCLMCHLFQTMCWGANMIQYFWIWSKVLYVAFTSWYSVTDEMKTEMFVQIYFRCATPDVFFFLSIFYMWVHEPWHCFHSSYSSLRKPYLCTIKPVIPVLVVVSEPDIVNSFWMFQYFEITPQSLFCINFFLWLHVHKLPHLQLISQ